MNDIYGTYLSVEDCAQELNLDHSTVWHFIKNNQLKAVNVGNGNYRPRYGVRLEDLNLFKKSYVKYYSETRGNSISKKRQKKKEAENKKKNDEIEELKAEIKIISEKLLELSVRLEELSK